MKLKKILAVALAATTALSSGTAYNLLGASTAYAQGPEKDETFVQTVSGGTQYNVVYSYTVTTEMPGSTTSGGAVKLTGVEFENKADHDNYEGPYAFSIPTSATPDDATYGSYKYPVTEVELDGASFSDLDTVGNITVGKASNLKSLILKNFENDGNKIKFDATSGSGTSLEAVKLETLDVTNSETNIDSVASFINASAGTLKTLNIKGLTNNNENDNVSTDKTLDLSSFTLLQNVDVSDNDILRTLKVVRGGNAGTTGSGVNVYAMTLNISNDTSLETLDVQGRYTRYVDALDGGNKGVNFITDESEEGSRSVDLSAYSIKTLTIEGAGIESLVLPSEAITAKVDNNLLTNLDVSPASDLKSLTANDNMLLDVDISGLGEMNSLNLNNNFLTSLDVSNCDSLKTAGAVASNNYIYKDNFVKASSGQSGVYAGDQNNKYTMYMYLTGDAGLKSNGSGNGGANAAGIVKIGGSATINAFFKVTDAPEGFAERFKDTITWKEANENGGAITLGEPTVVSAVDNYDGKGNKFNKYTAEITVSAPITGADVKSAQEKVTITAGNTKNTMGIQAEDAIIISYDTATNLPADKTSDENGDLKNVMYIPQQAAILPSSGTASVKLDAVAIKSVLDNDCINGAKLESWNTAADGTGTSYKFKSVGNGVTAKLSEDTALTAMYKEYTYSINFDPGDYYSSMSVDSVAMTGKKSGKTEAIKNLNWGEETALTANGFTSTVKPKNDEYDNSFIAWIDNGSTLGNAHKAFDDGVTVFANTVGAAKHKKDTAKLKALWSNGNFSMSLDNTSITLAMNDLDKSIYKIDDLGITVESMEDTISVPDKNTTAYSTDTDIVGVSESGYLFAADEGTATVYVKDKATGAVAAVAVTVTKDGTAATEDNTAKLTAGEKVKADNGQTVKLNSDGKTVTVSKGKNQKKVTVNTVVIDGVTYKVTAIAANAFKGMSKVQTVVIGNNVKTIGKLAFANCKNLKKVTMGKNVKKIGAKAFKNDKKLAKVLIKSKKLTTNAKVGSQAFKNTKSGIKFYIAKKAATFKKIKKVIKKKGQPTKAKYVKKYA